MSLSLLGISMRKQLFICVVPSNLSKALKRAPCPMLVIDLAKVVSYAEDGSWQVLPHKEVFSGHIWYL